MSAILQNPIVRVLAFQKRGNILKSKITIAEINRGEMKSIKAMRTLVPRFQVALQSSIARSYVNHATTNFAKLNSTSAAGLQAFEINSSKTTIPRYARSLASDSRQRSSSETRKDVTKLDDPFDAPTYNIPEKPVTFTEGASYSVLILAGLGVAAAAGYAVFKELIFEPKEYKIFGKALDRIQNDSQVRVRIGSPITGYGQESRNRAARQRIPNRVWTDEDAIEHVEVNFYIRGPHGAGKVGAEMFKDNIDKKWKFVYLIVEIRAPSPAQLVLESYVPA